MPRSLTPLGFLTVFVVLVAAPDDPGLGAVPAAQDLRRRSRRGPGDALPGPRRPPLRARHGEADRRPRQGDADDAPLRRRRRRRQNRRRRPAARLQESAPAGRATRRREAARLLLLRLPAA